MRRSRIRPLAAQIVANRRMTIGLVLAGGVVCLVLVGPLLISSDPLMQHLGFLLRPPDSRFRFGTDEFGRDIFIRVLYGGRVSLIVGAVAVPVGATIGVLLGIIAGYYGRRLDVLIMRPTEVVLAAPAIILGIALSSINGQGLLSIVIAIAIYNIPVFARLARAGAVGVVNREYVQAAVTMGARDREIIREHVFPNIVAPLVVQFGISFGVAIIIEAGLSYLGLGVQPPDPSWGSMLAYGQTYLSLAPWYAFFPGLLMVMLVLGVNLMADGLRDVLDPRSVSRFQRRRGTFADPTYSEMLTTGLPEQGADTRLG